jgi:hypothetical protein
MTRYEKGTAEDAQDDAIDQIRKDTDAESGGLSGLRQPRRGFAQSRR